MQPLYKNVIIPSTSVYSNAHAHIKGENIMSEEWVPLSEAAFQLKTEGFDVSVSKLSRLASRGEIKAESDPLDERVRLVELNQLRQLFGSSKRFKR